MIQLIYHSSELLAVLLAFMIALNSRLVLLIFGVKVIFCFLRLDLGPHLGFFTNTFLRNTKPNQLSINDL